MTLAAVNPFVLSPLSGTVPTGNMQTSIGSEQAVGFNAAGDKLAFVFCMRGSVVPDGVSFNISSVTTAGTAGAIDCTLETLDTAGLPSGTPVTNSATASVTASTVGIKRATGMAGTATVVQGTLYAVVLTAGSGWDRNLAITLTFGSIGANGIPYALSKDTAGAWTKATINSSGWSLGLDNAGTYLNIPGLVGAHSAFAFQGFNDSTNPDERGNRFSLNFPATLMGALIVYNAGSAPGSTDDYAIAIYSSHTSTPNQLQTKPFDGDAQTAGAMHICLFAADVDLTANTVYALTIKSTAADNVNLVRWTFAANADLDCFMGSSFYSTTRDGGSGQPANPGNNFTDDNAKVYGIFPILTRLDNGAGGGGGLAIPVSGRLCA